MSIVSKAGQAIRQAEARLQALIAEAAHSGEYAAIELLATCATDLQRICERLPRDLKDEESATSHVVSPTPEAPPQPSPSQETSARKGSSSRRQKRSDYPRFACSKDTLVKIGWSKAKKSEYRHKSPLSVLKALTAALSHAFESESIVAIESILPLTAQGGEEIPNYQAYLCVAWLRCIGVIKQQGRDGYAICCELPELAKRIDGEWEKLPKARP